MTTETTMHRSSAQARGERVRRLRNMANLSRPAMCEKSDFKIDTLIGWEVARHGGLTERGAQKILTRVAQEGVICTLEWLLHETGSSPTVIPDFPTKSLSNSDDQKIIAELLLFKTHYSDVMDHQILDDSMNPKFHRGDRVAGIKCEPQRWDTLIGHDCIVQLLNGDIIVRKICSGQEGGRYTLVPSNLENDSETLILANIEFLFAAPVIWHRVTLAHYKCFKKLPCD